MVTSTPAAIPGSRAGSASVCNIKKHFIIDLLHMNLVCSQQCCHALVYVNAYLVNCTISESREIEAGEAEAEKRKI